MFSNNHILIISAVCTCILASLITTFIHAHVALESHVSLSRKVLALCIDFLHVLVTYISVAYAAYIVLFSLLGRYASSQAVLCHALVLNTLTLVIVGLFLIHKMCILTIWYNRLLDIHPCTPFSASPMARMNFDGSKVDMQRGTQTDSFPCPHNTEMWMKSYSWLVALLVIVNIVVFTKIVLIRKSNPGF